MKKILFYALALVMLVSVASQAQIKFEVQVPDSLVGKVYLENYVKKVFKELSTGVITPPVVVVPAVNPCPAGPILNGIFSVTTVSLTAQFHGDGVERIKWAVLDASGSQIRYGDVKPSNNQPGITYDKLPAGKYTLTFRGSSCSSEISSFPFVIPGETGVVIPPIETPGESTPGVYSAAIVTNGLADHMDLKLTESNGVRLITDNARPPVSDGYEFRYMVGADLIKSKTPLKDYVFAGHNPLRVWKMKTKVGLETVNKWSDTPQEGGYYDYQAGQPFSENTTAALQTMVFPGAQEKSGFLNHIPQSYDPSTQNVQWADIMPDLTLPKGHVFFLNRGTWDMDQVLKKGVTHISHYQIPRTNGSEELAMKMKDQGITYNDVPMMQQLFDLPDNGVDKWVNGYNTRYWQNGPLTNEQATAQAARFAWVDALAINETMEGNYFMPESQPMWLPYYSRYRKTQIAKFDSKGIPSYLCHNYFMFWPKEYNLGHQELTREHFKNMLTLAPDKMPKSNFSPGGSLSATNLIVDAVYLNAPDVQNGNIFGSIYKLNVFHHLGYEGGIFLAPQHEWKPNNLVEYRYPDGKYYHYEKLPLDPNVIISYAFISQTFGKVFVNWGGGGKAPDAVTKPFDREWTTGAWFPTGSTSPKIPFPHTGASGLYNGYDGGTDFSRFGLQLWQDTFGLLEGGQTAYCTFRLDGGAWIFARNVNSDDIVDAAYDQHGIVYSIIKNGRIAWFYLNPFADNKWHDLQVQLPSGKVITERVAGNGIHAKIETL